MSPGLFVASAAARSASTGLLDGGSCALVAQLGSWKYIQHGCYIKQCLLVRVLYLMWRCRRRGCADSGGSAQVLLCDEALRG